MKKILLLILCFSIQFNYSQTKPLNKNTYEVKFDSLNQRIDNLKIEINSLKLKEQNSIKNINNLNTDLLFYKVKEDYYAAALAEQTTRFAIIISGILFLFSLISFGTFKFQVQRVKKFTTKNISKLEIEFNDYKEKLSKTSNDLIGAKGNLFTSIAIHFKKEKNYVNAFYYHLLAARAHGEHNENKEVGLESEAKSTKKDKYETSITNLNMSLKCLELAKTEKDKINKNIYNIKETLDSVSVFKNEKVKNLIAKIRILIDDITK